MQNICASEYYVPIAGKSGIGGFNVSLESLGFQVCHGNPRIH